MQDFVPHNFFNESEAKIYSDRKDVIENNRIEREQHLQNNNEPLPGIMEEKALRRSLRRGVIFAIVLLLIILAASGCSRQENVDEYALFRWSFLAMILAVTIFTHSHRFSLK